MEMRRLIVCAMILTGLPLLVAAQVTAPCAGRPAASIEQAWPVVSL